MKEGGRNSQIILLTKEEEKVPHPRTKPLGGESPKREELTSQKAKGKRNGEVASYTVRKTEHLRDSRWEEEHLSIS